MTEPHTDLRRAILEVVCRVFALPNESAAAEASPDTVAGWDSEKHVELVVALEDRFGCLFEPEDIPELTSIAQMEEAIRRHG